MVDAGVVQESLRTALGNVGSSSVRSVLSSYEARGGAGGWEWFTLEGLARCAVFCCYLGWLGATSLPSFEPHSGPILPASPLVLCKIGLMTLLMQVGFHVAWLGTVESIVMAWACACTYAVMNNRRRRCVPGERRRAARGCTTTNSVRV